MSAAQRRGSSETIVASSVKLDEISPMRGFLVGIPSAKQLSISQPLTPRISRAHTGRIDQVLGPY